MLYRILWFSPKTDPLPSSLISSVTTPHFELSTRNSILCSSLKIPNHCIPMFLCTWCSLHLECCICPVWIIRSYNEPSLTKILRRIPSHYCRRQKEKKAESHSPVLWKKFVLYHSPPCKFSSSLSFSLQHLKMRIIICHMTAVRMKKKK